MAAPAPRLQEQNLNILDNGITRGGKSYMAKAEKKVGGLGGRKALNDISNSRKPSAHHSVKKDNSINVLPTEKNTFAAKPTSTKAPEKGKVRGRKALTDLTNSAKPTSEQPLSLRLKANDVKEERIPICVTEERFIHNHQECVAAQTKGVDMDYFLKSSGLHHEIPLHPSAIRAVPVTPKKQAADRSTKMHLELEEDAYDLEHQFEGPKHPQCLKPEVPGCFSPACRSPQSPKAPYMSWEDAVFSDFKIMDTPKVA